VSGRNDFDESTIGLSANLDFLFKRGSRVKSARLRNRISKLELETRKIKLAKELGETFIDHSYLKREIKQLEGSLEQHKKALDIATELVGKGMIPKVSLQQIKFRIEELDFNLRDFNDKNAQLLAKFRLLVGSMKAVPEDNEILVDALLTDSKSAVNTAWENRKDLLVQKEHLEWRKQEVHRLKRENFPDVTFEVASKQYATNENGTFWGISIELPLGETRGQGKIAKAEADQFALQYEEFRRQVAREVASAREAFNYWCGAKENSTDIDIQSRKDFLQTAKVRFQSGESGVLEYLDALDAHLNSIQKISLTELRKDKAYLNLISSCGRYLTFENSAQ
jgi:outer membrane protein TolC